jgi:hypothetical protein
MEADKTYLGREIVHEEVFPAGEKDDFSGYYDAENYLKELGYTRGSMCRSEPIGFADSDKYRYIAKWYNISREEQKDLDGVMVSSSFRGGEVRVIFFNPPKTNK